MSSGSGVETSGFPGWLYMETTDDNKINTLPVTKTKQIIRKKKKSSVQLEVKLPVLCERKKDSVHSALDTVPGAPNRTQS